MLSYEDCVASLYAIPMFGKKSGLDKIERLLSFMDDPHKKLKFIHVTGTNGKGSVCKMLSTIYTQAGYKVGLFTSPHIERVNERIQVCNEPIQDNCLIEAYEFVINLVSNHIKDDHPTFFEIMFLMALYHFMKTDVEIIVLEVGIGGLLDVTNVIKNPLMEIITQVDYDHIDILGSSLSDIAYQKAGIIKRDSKVLFLEQNKEVEDVIRNVCEEKNIEPIKIHKLFHEIETNSMKGIDFSYKYKYYKYIGLHLNTVAKYQVTNASIAITGVLELEEVLKVEEVHIRKSLEAFYWPGRMEVIDSMVLDGAHNVNGISIFKEEISELFPNKRFNIIFAVKKTKDYANMLRTLISLEGINQLILVSMDDQVNQHDDTLNHLIKEYSFIRFSESLESAFNEFYQKQNDEIFLCVGSLYLISAIKQLIGGYKND